MFRVVQKWKTLKHRQLNKESYHDIEMQADRAKDVLLELQGALNGDPMNVQLQVQVNEALQKCRERGLAREKSLQQKAKIDWLNSGDQNTAYFHRVIQQRQYRKRIMQIKDGATTLE